MIGLSKRQQIALDYIKRCIAERGIPPTLREIGKSMRIRSTNGVNDHLRALERKGYIRRSDMLSRSIVLLKDSKPADLSKVNEHLEEELQQARSKLQRLREILAEP